MMFVRIPKAIEVKGKRHSLCIESEQRFGIRPGIYLLKDGVIKGPKGEASYWKFHELMDILPVYHGNWNDISPIAELHEGDFITTDLITESGLMLQKDVTMKLHEVQYMNENLKEAYLLLCSIGDYYFQVISF